jgi:hypothetical protein
MPRRSTYKDSGVNFMWNHIDASITIIIAIPRMYKLAWNAINAGIIKKRFV